MVLPEDGATRLHGLSHVIHDSIEVWNDGERFTVPCTTVDLLFGALDIQGIKIDVEKFIGHLKEENDYFRNLKLGSITMEEIKKTLKVVYGIG